MIRKIDLTAQAVIGSISLLSLLTFSPYICLLGELLLGAWQVISAAFNTSNMVQTTFRARIKWYWIVTLSALLLLFLPEVRMFIVVASWGIAVYYWFVYRAFINYLSYRKELSTIVK